MAREKEIKINLKMSLAEFEARLRERGFREVATLEQRDIYFDTRDWLLYECLAALRLRIVDGRDDSFAFKKMYYLDSWRDKFYIEEIQVEAPFGEADGEKLGAIWRRLGIAEAARGVDFGSGEDFREFLGGQGFLGEQDMRKTRQVFEKDGNEVSIDDVSKVGVVVELECEREEPLEVVRGILKEGEWERTVEGTSYIWLKNVKGLDSHVANRRRFEREADWNVWENEREMYERLRTRGG